MKKVKVATIVGTRPEIIRLSRVIALLDQVCDHVLIHTGQNYDYELSDIFFDQLRIPKPDHYLDVDTSSLGATLGGVIAKSEQVLLAEKPDAVLILGDTNSSMAGIMAKRMKIPIYHMEAGNRCFDQNVPEETNRRIIDRIADFNLVYTEHARRHLLSDGLPHRRIYLTGSPMKEVLDHYATDIDQAAVLDELGLKDKGYFLVSMHREENVDNESNLRQLLAAIDGIVERYGQPVLVSTHPRTRKRLDALDDYRVPDQVTFAKPFGFYDYNKLQKHARCVLSDSGTISEESAILGFSAVTIRNAMERPEALDTGSIVLTGVDPTAILSAVELVTTSADAGGDPVVPVDYLVDNVSQRVARLIVGTAGLSNDWDGIVRNDTA
ncbi:MAG: UDP-N-acetylglucosamine 2-epimerase (non-hydrolyzing) [Pseudomonadota bacterium]